jgi:hypothetical protein
LACWLCFSKPHLPSDTSLGWSLQPMSPLFHYCSSFIIWKGSKHWNFLFLPYSVVLLAVYLKAGVTGACHVLSYFIDRVLLSFCLGWPWSEIFPISTSWEAGITGISHCTWLNHMLWSHEYSHYLFLLFPAQLNMICINTFLLLLWERSSTMSVCAVVQLILLIKNLNKNSIH